MNNPPPLIGSSPPCDREITSNNANDPNPHLDRLLMEIWAVSQDSSEASTAKLKELNAKLPHAVLRDRGRYEQEIEILKVIQLNPEGSANNVGAQIKTEPDNEATGNAFVADATIGDAAGTLADVIPDASPAAAADMVVEAATNLTTAPAADPSSSLQDVPAAPFNESMPGHSIAGSDGGVMVDWAASAVPAALPVPPIIPVANMTGVAVVDFGAANQSESAQPSNSGANRDSIVERDPSADRGRDISRSVSSGIMNNAAMPRSDGERSKGIQPYIHPSRAGHVSLSRSAQPTGGSFNPPHSWECEDYEDIPWNKIASANVETQITGSNNIPVQVRRHVTNLAPPPPPFPQIVNRRELDYSQAIGMRNSDIAQHYHDWRGRDYMANHSERERGRSRSPERGEERHYRVRDGGAGPRGAKREAVCIPCLVTSPVKSCDHRAKCQNCSQAMKICYYQACDSGWGCQNLSCRMLHPDQCLSKKGKWNIAESPKMSSNGTVSVCVRNKENLPKQWNQNQSNASVSANTSTKSKAKANSNAGAGPNRIANTNGERNTRNDKMPKAKTFAHGQNSASHVLQPGFTMSFRGVDRNGMPLLRDPAPMFKQEIAPSGQVVAEGQELQQNWLQQTNTNAAAYRNNTIDHSSSSLGDSESQGAALRYFPRQ